MAGTKITFQVFIAIIYKPNFVEYFFVDNLLTVKHRKIPRIYITSKTKKRVFNIVQIWVNAIVQDHDKMCENLDIF